MFLAGSTPYLSKTLVLTFACLCGIDFCSKEKLLFIEAASLLFGACVNISSLKDCKACPRSFKTLLSLWQLQILKLLIPDFCVWIIYLWAKLFIRWIHLGFIYRFKAMYLWLICFNRQQAPLMIHIPLCAHDTISRRAIVKGTKHRCCIVSWCIKKVFTLHFSLNFVNNSGDYL